MADSPEKRSSPERAVPEDPDTAATRKELKQTAISDKTSTAAHRTGPPSATSTADGDLDDKKTGASTPELSHSQAYSDDMRERVSSPKKKRAHDEVDKHQDQSHTANGDVSPVAGSDHKSDRYEPEKKRARDVSSEVKAKLGDITVCFKADL